LRHPCRVVARSILHVDLDQFIAAVEVLRRPELRGLPVVVGGDGDPTKRGVVSTGSYEARAFGIRSGMPLRTAFKKCPDAVFLPVDAEHYLAASRDVMATLKMFPAVVEVAGWDEAFMEVLSDDPERLAREVQRAVLERTRLWCSIGIGDNKLRAKIASDMAKPQGVFWLTSENWHAVMDELPPRALWGIGPKSQKRLQALGIGSVAELADADERTMTNAFGPGTGVWFGRLARGENDSPVTDEPHRPKSRGRERTFQRDLTDPDQVRREIASLAREVAGDMANDDDRRLGRRVVVKVRFAPFVTHTHGAPLHEPSMDPSAIETTALAALASFELDRPIRLLGVKVELEPPA
jgi:nucleotidyltransferase/DNA polymerase involved in DNA repair